MKELIPIPGALHFFLKNLQFAFTQAYSVKAASVLTRKSQFGSECM